MNKISIHACLILSITLCSIMHILPQEISIEAPEDTLVEIPAPSSTMCSLCKTESPESDESKPLLNNLITLPCLHKAHIECLKRLYTSDNHQRPIFGEKNTWFSCRPLEAAIFQCPDCKKELNKDAITALNVDLKCGDRLCNLGNCWQSLVYVGAASALIGAVFGVVYSLDAITHL